MNHGTLTAYVHHKCRCEECRRTHYRYYKRYRMEKIRGVDKLVDPAPMHAHVERLKRAGMSEWDITLAAGWKSRNSLASVLRAEKVTPRTMQRVLAVKPVSDRRNRYVDATGSRRRLQALAVAGWPYRVIAERIGSMCPETIAGVQSGSTRTIRAWVADEVARVYDELWATPGPSPRSATIARRKQWAPALAWDDDAIDDPAAEPHGIDWQPRKRDRAALVEDFAEMRDAGMTFAACAMRLGMTESALERALHRAKADGMTIPEFGKESAA